MADRNRYTPYNTVLAKPGLGVGVQEVRGSNSSEPPIIAPPISCQIGLTRKIVRVNTEYSKSTVKQTRLVISNCVIYKEQIRRKCDVNDVPNNDY